MRYGYNCCSYLWRWYRIESDLYLRKDFQSPLHIFQLNIQFHLSIVSQYVALKPVNNQFDWKWKPPPIDFCYTKEVSVARLSAYYNTSSPFLSIRKIAVFGKHRTDHDIYPGALYTDITMLCLLHLQRARKVQKETIFELTIHYHGITSAPPFLCCSNANEKVQCSNFPFKN